MKTQACVPCAKRKVRCDRKEPCSNCKRRKHDQCSYHDVLPAVRIQKLEALIRRLGGSPDEADEAGGDHGVAAERRQTPPSQQDTRTLNDADCEQSFDGSHRPVIVKAADGESAYMETRGWDSWNGEKAGRVAGRRMLQHEKPLGASRKMPSALFNILRDDPDLDLAQRHPSPSEAAALWTIYFQRVNPLMKITFDRELEKLKAAAIAPLGVEEIFVQEHALIFAVYLNSVNSLTKGECLSMFQRPKPVLLSDYQMLCEHALARSDFFVTSDITTLQALTLYLACGIEMLSPRSLWALMGVVIRNAEKIGLHRDGTLLGLSPYETERRRRLWWQLQQIDLALAVHAGATSLTLGAQWDTTLPLNIEDKDLQPNTRSFPKERQGLTGISCCLWSYWVIQQQRSACSPEARLSWLSWSSDESSTMATKEAFIDKLQEGLNRKFLQFCDPVRPIDHFILIVARSFICLMRRGILHPLANSAIPSENKDECRSKLLQVCMKTVEYDIAMYSSPFTEPFRWRARSFFPWGAFIYVLVEACQEHDESTEDEIWAMLSRVYVANRRLSELGEDRRNVYAAELAIAAWKAHERSTHGRRKHDPPAIQPRQRPSFLQELDAALHEHRSASERTGGEAVQSITGTMPRGRSAKKPQVLGDWDVAPGPQDSEPWMRETASGLLDMDAIAELNVDEIDWSFLDAFISEE